MDRRQVVALSIGPLASGGLALIVPSLNPEFAQHAEIFRLFGAAGIAMSLGIWLALLLTAEQPKSADQRRYIGLRAAGAWLYERAPASVKESITRNVPSLYETADEGAEIFVKGAITKGVVDLYARRGAGLPIEVVPSKDMEFSAFEQLFGTDKPKLLDLSIRRHDLRRVLKHYGG